MIYKTIFVLLFFTYLNVILGDFSEEFYEKWLKKYREVSGNETPPLKYKLWITLTASLNCSIDPEDYKQIFADLKPFKDMKLTVKKVKKLKKKLKKYGINENVSGKQKKLFLKTRLNWPFEGSLAYLPFLLDPKKDFYVINNINDEGIVAPADDNQKRAYKDMTDVVKRCKAVRDAHAGYSNKNMFLRAPTSFISVPFNVPVFSTNRLKGYKDIILPSTRTGLPVHYPDYDEAIDAPAWEDKMNKAVFRGRTTGVNFKKVRKENIPLTQNVRFKLHEMAMQQRQGKLNCSIPLDFGFTEIWQCKEGKSYVKKLKKNFPLVPELDYETQFKYKYLVIADGNGWPDRVAHFMLSGSLVFLATVHEEWVINQLKDGVNYIKIKPDLSDLVEKLEWAAKNDKEAKIIASNGRKFAKEKFELEPMQAYNSLLFMEYERLFT